jgi:HD-GYP domain-containing protein (c-di-GMP phosphodiesterase class II)
MTSDRPYRVSEMTLPLAIEELQRHSGTQFDPSVVDAIITAAGAGDLQLLPRTATHAVVVPA